ncbi:hypothetical protein [Bacillus sp. N447-1]|uniref:hypothetical protein n=1 Tax=Bacillus sp. N447-1 TaxID=2789208 RepID=UPI0032B34BFA
MSVIDKQLRKHVPNSLDLLITPFLMVVITGFLSLIIWTYNIRYDSLRNICALFSFILNQNHFINLSGEEKIFRYNKKVTALTKG